MQILLPAAPDPAVTPSELRERRKKLRAKLENSVIVLFGRTEREAGDSVNGFKQEPNFYYLTGIAEPGAALVLTPADDILLLPRHNRVQERWTGPKPAPEDKGIQELTGFHTVVEMESFEARLPEWVKTAPKIYSLPGGPLQNLQRMLPLREISDVTLPVARLRMVKSPAEIALIQRATDATMEAHRAAWKRLRPGVTEYQIASTMMATYFEQGCEGNAYPPIVGSGPNGTILHYSKNRRTIDQGELVLMDVGAECGMYATDITRTIPAGDRFTERQRELYEIVLGAQRAVIDAIRPGMTLGRETPNSLHQIAVQYFNSHGKARNGDPLGKYFIHGLGHHVGLEVHDASDPALPLAAGMVITVEPGLYIPEEGIGIRIEDMVLVTGEGCKVLSSTLPSSVAAVEKARLNRH